MSRVLMSVLFFVAFTFCVSYGKDHNIPKQPIPPSKAPPLPKESNQALFIEKSRSSPPPQLNSIAFDSARNGYGLGSSTPKSVDAITDLLGGDWVGAAYHKFIPGLISNIIGIMQYDINNLFDLSNFLMCDLLSIMPNYGIGGFLSFQAAPGSPIPIWIQYNISGISDAYLTTDIWGWGCQGGWIPPVSWLQNTDPNIISDVWSGSTDLFLAPSDTHYVGGVWEVGLNSGDYTFLYGKSTDLVNWTFNSGAIQWHGSHIEMNPPRFAYGNNGFGAWVSTGYFVGDPDDDFKLMLCTTNDYGATWGPVQRFEWSDIGIPTQITADDSIFIPDSLGDSVLYVGPAQVGITYTFDLVIPPTNELHVGCTIIWGPKDNQGYIPHRKWMGLYDLQSADMGQTWTPSRIWWNSGLLASDSTGQFILTNEIDLGYDDAGNIYAAWVDRDPHNSVPSPFPRTDDRFSEPVSDVFASMSPDGGNSWPNPPLQITDDQQHSAYGLRLSSRAKWFPQENGKTYVMYQIADFSRVTVGPPTTCADHVNWLYLAEVKNFPPPVSVEDEYQSLTVPPDNFVLYQNYPNPFNPNTVISYQLAVGSTVDLTIYNILGQRVKQLVHQKQPAGFYELKWDGRDERDNLVGSGIYYYRLKAGNFSQSKKILLLR